MKRFCSYIIILWSLLLLLACSRSLVDDAEPDPKPIARRTVIVYMVSDNQPYLPVPKDTAEMIAGKHLIPEDVNFVIYLDDKNHHPTIYELSAKGGMKLCRQYADEYSTTDSLVMLNALRDIQRYFPAQHYGLTLWSHATGWAPERNSTRQKTFGKDETPGSTPTTKIEMEIPVLRDVLAQLPKFDYIFFDACFMQCIEVAYELRNVANWIVGSPAEIPGPGAPYDKIIPALCNGDAMGIAQGYGDGYPGKYNNYYYPGVLLSCIDCSKLDELAQITGQYLKPFYMNHTEPVTQDFQSYCDITIGKFTYSFDMRTTMCRLLSPEDYQTWMAAFDQAVPLRYLPETKQWYAQHCRYGVIWDPDCYGGVSMFVPMEKYSAYGWNEDFRKTSWYAATGWAETGW